jgi:hypothetical protein
MVAEEEKKELIDWISGLDDRELLQALKSIKESQSKTDWWEETPNAAKESIQRGEEDFKRGRTHPHNKIRYYWIR